MTNPKPEVVYLPAIFQAIRDGEIRVPAFQRGFVWKPSQILQLLDSVYRSYPIGSLLFWHVDVEEMKTEGDPSLPFPHPVVEGDVDFILDGMQRLSSLWGAFHGGDDNDNMFDVAFDLQSEDFQFSDDAAAETSIPLRALFVPRQLLVEQARLGQLDDGEELVDRSIAVQQAFQNYLIPIVRIGKRSSEEVVEIFERVNTAGTKLDAVDFMRALTWSSEFDLNDELERLAALDEVSHLAIPPNTIAKCIALLMEVFPTSEDMLALRRAPADTLRKATDAVAAALVKTADFLAEELGVRSYDFVPYEGQFLVLVAAAARAGDDELPSTIKAWFWSVGFSESLQGRPDHVIARMAMATLRGEEHDGLTPGLQLTIDGLILRNLRKSAALSMSVVAALATKPVHSVFTGLELSELEFMAGYEPTQTGGIFELQTLRDALEPAPRTELICNVILVEREERGASGHLVRDAIISMADAGRWEVLESQAIDETCVEALRNGDVAAFLYARAAQIHARAAELCTTA